VTGSILAPKDFRRYFEQRAIETAGVRLDKRWEYRAAGALAAVMRENGATTWEQLETLLDAPGTGSALVERLVGEVTVQETRLFRDAGQMRLLREEVLPDVCKRAIERKMPLRVWSAGCASGEEAYSLAMLAAECTREGRDLPYTVVGTDISASAIATARRGVYREPEEGSCGREFRSLFDRYTVADAEGMISVSEEIRRNTRFAVRNLLGTLPVRGQDFVLCRNVMMYLSTDARERLIRRLWDSLVPGGWLLTGEADLIHQIPNLFETRNYGRVALYRRPLSASPLRTGGELHG